MSPKKTAPAAPTKKAALSPRKKTKRVTPRAKAATRATRPKAGDTPMSLAELRARATVVHKVLDDVRSLTRGEARGAKDFETRAAQALALLDEAATLLPRDEALTPEDRARLEAEAREMPDEDMLRQILELAQKMRADPNIPAEAKRELDAIDLGGAVQRLEEIKLLDALSRDLKTLVHELEDGPSSAQPEDAWTGFRLAAERLAAKQRN